MQKFPPTRKLSPQLLYSLQCLTLSYPRSPELLQRMHLPIVRSGMHLCNLYHKIKESSSCQRWEDVLSFYREINKVEVLQLDHTIFSHILKACLTLSCRLGQSVHAHLIKLGYEAFSSVSNSLIDFYAKSGKLGYSMAVFNCMKAKDSVSWNIILHGYLAQGSIKEGLDLYAKARAARFEPNISTLVLVIQALRSLEAFNDGQRYHGYLIRSGFSSLNSVQNLLLDMYTDFCMSCAETLFGEMNEKDVISWTVMIKGYVNGEDVTFALESFRLMVSDGEIEVDGQTMVSVIKGCTSLGDVRAGKLMHSFIVKRALNYDLFLGNTLIDFYCKYGNVDSALLSFNEMPLRNIVSWNTLLSGFVHNGNHAEALTLYFMMQKSGVDVDGVTLVNLLQIFKIMGNLLHSKLIHSVVIRRGFWLNDLVMNSLIDVYAKCNQINLSGRLFCQIERPDIVTWSTMISGFTHCGRPDEAIALYKEMQLYVEKPSPVTLLNLLEACSLSAEIGRSRWAHGLAIRMVLASDVVVGTAILEMYSKCGAIEASRRAFDQILAKNIVSWSAIIAAYGLNGLPHDALALLSEMEAQGLKPNPVTILSVLSACCHGGLVKEGLSIFKQFADTHGAELKSEHYSCLVDLLARSGSLDDASELIKSIPRDMELRASAWGALLSASRSYEIPTFTASALSRVIELEPKNSAGYLLASNSYHAGGSFLDASGMRHMMKERGIKVVAAYSLVHVGNKAYTFTAGDKCHSLSHVLFPVIEHLHSCMRIDTGSRSPVH